MPITDTCRFAWNSSKKAHQPEYDALIESYRDMLSARAEAVLATGMTDDGPFAAFEQAVLNAPPEPVASSDQGYEQVTDAEGQREIIIPIDPVTIEVTEDMVDEIVERSAETLEEVETARLERAKRREEAQPTPKKKPLRKVVVAVKKSAAKPPTKKTAKKVAPKK